MSVADYNTDPNSNTSISGINIAEGCPPSGINNAIRQMMADIKDKADSTDTAITTLDTNVVKLSGNQTVSGTKTFTSSISITAFPAMYNPDEEDDNVLQIIAGHSTNGAAGAKLSLAGANVNGANQGGDFTLQAGKSGAYCQFIGKPDGTLTWGGSNVITAAGGTFTGAVTINSQTNARSIIPNVSNSYTLGVSGTRWKEIWCNQSSINTSSDERIKQQIADIPDAVLDAWDDVNWIQFKYNDSVEEKGADNARLHNGLIAQRVDEAFKAHGLDASKYGLFLYDQWDAEPEQKDENGNVTIPAQEAGDAYGLRYTEALCMEAAYQRRRADRAEARITSLERRLDEMEAVLATLGA